MVFVRLGLWVCIYGSTAEAIWYVCINFTSTNGEIIVSHEVANGEKTSLCIFEICASFALLIYVEGMAPLSTSQVDHSPLFGL